MQKSKVTDYDGYMRKCLGISLSEDMTVFCFSMEISCVVYPITAISQWIVSMESKKVIIVAVKAVNLIAFSM